jgi:transcriptional regulator with XRE-family HTH domain
VHGRPVIGLQPSHGSVGEALSTGQLRSSVPVALAGVSVFMPKSLAWSAVQHDDSRVSRCLGMQGYKGIGDTGGVSFGRRLREYRDHRRWSLADLCKATHYSRSYLSNIENGRKAPTDDLARLCDEALRAKGELIAAAREDLAAKLDRTPWQTAELVQRMQASDTTSQTLETLQSTIDELPQSSNCAASTATATPWTCAGRLTSGSSTSAGCYGDRSA